MPVTPGTPGVASTPPTVTVPVVSAWYSKINWTQALSVGVMLATMAGVVVPAGLQETLLAAIVAVQAVVTVVLKTYFTSSVTPSSVK